MKKILLMAGSLAVLGGCQTLDLIEDRVGEPTEIVVDVPQAPDAVWVERAPNEMPTTDWVAEFSDSQLIALVDEALERNSSIRAASAAYEAALARVDIADSERLPTVTGSADASRREFGDSLIPGASSFGLGVNASWEADLWGRIRDQIDASEVDAAAFKADYAGARLAIAAQVAQTWFNLIEARLLVELSERDVETQERALRLTERRFDGGVVGSSDVRLARSSVANAEALRASRRQSQASLARSLEILLRRYPAEALDPASDLPVLPVLDGAGVPADLLVRRPDLIAAEYRLQASGLDVDVARKALLPSLNLSGGLNSGAGGLFNILDFDSFVANIAAGLTQPIFNGGRLDANVDQQEAILRQQAESYAGTVLDAYLEVENALDAEQRLLERESALRRSLNEALEAEERLEIRYSEGLATILQLLDAQSRRISAESQLISARKERLANRVRLYVALGGGEYGDVNVAMGTNLSNLSP